MTTTIAAAGVTTTEIDARDSDAASGVSGAAIFAGAAAAATLSMLLVMLALTRALVGRARRGCGSGDGAGNNASATPYFVDSLFRDDAPVADEARKAAAATSLWMFVALLAGAFFASVAALSGGRRRDSRA